MLRLLALVNSQAEGRYPALDSLDQSLDQRPLHSSPISDLVDYRFAMLVQQLLRWPRSVTAAGYVKDIGQISIQRQFPDGDLLQIRLSIELADRSLHLVDHD